MKILIARLFDLFFINHLVFFLTRRRYGRSHIRAVNYHGTPLPFQDNFERQVRFFKKYYCDVNEEELLEFVERGLWKKDKPGVIISFDDGLKNNYDIALPILERYGFTGWFCLPVGFVECDPKHQQEFALRQRISRSFEQDTRIAMSKGEIKQAADKHVIVCHTYSHHRMSDNDESETLHKEIFVSKAGLGKIVNREVKGFCWVGGETHTYTKSAHEAIQKANYRYAFMTNNYPVKPKADPLWIQRTNVESDMPLFLVRFYLCGLYDFFYRKKRSMVYHKLSN